MLPKTVTFKLDGNKNNDVFFSKQANIKWPVRLNSRSDSAYTGWPSQPAIIINQQKLIC